MSEKCSVTLLYENIEFANATRAITPLLPTFSWLDNKIIVLEECRDKSAKKIFKKYSEYYQITQDQSIIKDNYLFMKAA